jgi:hypothetical protein
MTVLLCIAISREQKTNGHIKINIRISKDNEQ